MTDDGSRRLRVRLISLVAAGALLSASACGQSSLKEARDDAARVVDRGDPHLRSVTASTQSAPPAAPSNSRASETAEQMEAADPAPFSAKNMTLVFDETKGGEPVGEARLLVEPWGEHGLTQTLHPAGEPPMTQFLRVDGSALYEIERSTRGETCKWDQPRLLLPANRAPGQKWRSQATCTLAGHPVAWDKEGVVVGTSTRNVGGRDISVVHVSTHTGVGARGLPTMQVIEETLFAPELGTFVDLRRAYGPAGRDPEREQHFRLRSISN